ncbi:MAG: DUF3108 domain-containing protein [Bacteroidota bacterium]|nr:DUF3108 domain-containing protein [Bacteroidota bacterium]MDP4206502.1 DUF3108 domain-containing protein [Bacteroidota bacterium]
MKRFGIIVFCLLIGWGVFPSIVSAQEFERLEYDLSLGFIRGGKATFFSRDTTLMGKKTIHYKAWGRTVGVVDALYKVDDTYESWVNPSTFLPFKAIRNVRERSYRDYSVAYFHQDKDSVFDPEKGWMQVPGNTTDIISIFFYLRKQRNFDSLKVGETFVMSMWQTGKVYPLAVKYMGVKSLKTSFGKIDCYVLSPQIKAGKLFKKTDGMTVWISKDANKVPLLLDFDIRVGTLKCELTEFRKYGKVVLKR